MTLFQYTLPHFLVSVKCARLPISPGGSARPSAQRFVNSATQMRLVSILRHLKSPKHCSWPLSPHLARQLVRMHAAMQNARRPKPFPRISPNFCSSFQLARATHNQVIFTVNSNSNLMSSKPASQQSGRTAITPRNLPSTT